MRSSFSLGFVQCHTTWRKLYFADLPSSESKSPVPGLWLKKLLVLSLFQLVVKTLCVPSENKSVLIAVFPVLYFPGENIAHCVRYGNKAQFGAFILYGFIQ